jgi:hypothetical protein
MEEIVRAAVLCERRIAQAGIDALQGLIDAKARGDVRLRSAPIAAGVQVHRAVRADVLRREDGVVVVFGVEHPCEHNLLLIVQADRARGFEFGPVQRRQEHPGQDGDDRDHDEQFDQGECGPYG